jgi:hypothetical protein
MVLCRRWHKKTPQVRGSIIENKFLTSFLRHLWQEQPLLERQRLEQQLQLLPAQHLLQEL